MQDSKATHMLQSLMVVPQNLSKLVTNDKGSSIAASSRGVWFVQGNRNALHVCRGSILGIYLNQTLGKKSEKHNELVL